jgi:hypothetical protein
MLKRMTAAALGGLALMAASDAQAGDYCRRYAEGAVRMANQAARCGIFEGFHTNWHHHYSWCERNPSYRSENATNRMRYQVSSCAPPQGAYRAPPPPPAYAPPPVMPRQTVYPAPQPVYADTGWLLCADEGGPCAVQGRGTVRYGANGSYTTMTVGGNIHCTNETFGVDPAPGIRKTCQVRY